VFCFSADITFTQAPCGDARVLVTVNIVGLSPGKHGFHIHELWVNWSLKCTRLERWLTFFSVLTAETCPTVARKFRSEFPLAHILNHSNSHLQINRRSLQPWWRNPRSSRRPHSPQRWFRKRHRRRQRSRFSLLLRQRNLALWTSPHCRQIRCCPRKWRWSRKERSWADTRHWKCWRSSCLRCHWNQASCRLRILNKNRKWVEKVDGFAWKSSWSFR
jgi:hypothetical protein